MRFRRAPHLALAVLTAHAAPRPAATSPARHPWALPGRPARPPSSAWSTATRSILALGHDDERVRLIGIDTPETVKPDTPVQCWGPQASAHMKHLLTPGTAVRVARDAEPRDKYGRLLLYIWRVRDGLFVNLDLAADGFARILSIEPNTAHEADLAAAVAAGPRLGPVWVCGELVRPPGDRR